MEPSVPPGSGAIRRQSSPVYDPNYHPNAEPLSDNFSNLNLSQRPVVPGTPFVAPASSFSQPGLQPVVPPNMPAFRPSAPPGYMHPVARPPLPDALGVGVTQPSAGLMANGLQPTVPPAGLPFPGYANEQLGLRAAPPTTAPRPYQVSNLHPPGGSGFRTQGATLLSQPQQQAMLASGHGLPPYASSLHTSNTQSPPVSPPPLAPVSSQPPRTYGVPPPPSVPSAISSVGQPGSPVFGSHVNPNQIPRIVPSFSVILHDTRQGNQPNPPPPVASDFIVRETGNCSPRYMRCTINQVPCTVDLLTSSGMQLSLLIQPLAIPHPSEDPIQVVDFGESGPVRCSRCKGYINPFMVFIDQGRRFICNLCGFTDDTPRDYQCNLGPDGRRRDADDRPELCRGTVEFVATKEYMVRDPMPAVYFFLIDVSLNAIQTGATAAACSSISQIITDLPEGPQTLVGVATFDSTIHFYNLKRELQQPLMLIVPDVQDVYTPLQTDVVVTLPECRQHLEILLESIPLMFQNNRTAESAFGAAIKAAYLSIKTSGGKLLVFQSVLPSVGTGALSAREAEGRSNASAGETEANRLLQPADKDLKELAIEFAEYQVCVDLFITSQTYVDIASLSVIPRTTGGQVYYYYPFSALSDTSKLYNDLRWNVSRPQGFEAVMRVRCSQGIQVQEYHGNFCKRTPTDVDLPAIDCDKTFMVTLKHDDKFQEGSECAFQCALLYTTLYGQRRIRVATLSLSCTNNLIDLFRTADLDTQFVCITKQVANILSSSSLVHARDQVTNFCINILYAYRKYCSTVSSSGQLILPEAFKLLPLYTLALLKSTGLRIDGKIDDRSFWISYISSISAPLAIPLLHPRLIAIHNLDTQDESKPLMPAPLPLSSEHVSDNGIYLLENGLDCLIYIGDAVERNLLQQLLGISSIDELPPQFMLQQYDNPLSTKLNNVLNEIRRQRCSFLRLKLCKKGEQSGLSFFSYLLEDKVPAGGLSYVEFLVHIHRQIQIKMSS